MFADQLGEAQFKSVFLSYAAPQLSVKVMLHEKIGNDDF